MIAVDALRAGFEPPLHALLSAALARRNRPCLDLRRSRAHAIDVAGLRGALEGLADHRELGEAVARTVAAQVVTDARHGLEVVFLEAPEDDGDVVLAVRDELRLQQDGRLTTRRGSTRTDAAHTPKNASTLGVSAMVDRHLSALRPHAPILGGIRVTNCHGAWSPIGSRRAPSLGNGAANTRGRLDHEDTRRRRRSGHA